MSDDDYNNQTPPPTRYAFKGTKAVTKGYELQMTGKLAPGWQDIYNSPYGNYEAFSQDAYWLANLMTRYQITKDISATLNVNHSFDKSYCTNIDFYNCAGYGEPRNVMVTTRWDC